jgi:hypothetical protein
LVCTYRDIIRLFNNKTNLIRRRKMKIPAWAKSGGVWLKGLLAAAIGGAVSSAGTIAAQQMSTGTMPSGNVMEGAAIAGAMSGAVLYLMNPPKEKVILTSTVSGNDAIPIPMTAEEITSQVKKQVEGDQSK